MPAFRRSVYLYLPIAVALCTLAACGDDDDGSDALEVAAPIWERDSYFRFGDAEQMNSHSTGDKLYFQGDLFTVQTPAGPGDTADYERVTYGVGSNKDYDDRKLPLSDEIVVTYRADGAGTLRFHAADNPTVIGAERRLSIAEHDEEFVAFALNSYWLGECMSISEQGRILVPYTADPEDPTRTRELRLALITVPVDTGGVVGTELLEPEMEVIRLDQDVLRTLLGPHPVEGGFVASDRLGVFYISTDGAVERVSDKPIDKFVDAGDLVYGVGDRPAVDGPPAADIYVSEDRGRTWRRTAQLERGLIFLNYAEVEGRVVGYRLDQLYAFDFAAATGVELDNAGLGGAAITSVTAHDSVAYVTTLSGVFTKPLDDFWTERREE